LQSQSFFATEKIVWWRGTNLLGSNSTASAAGTADSLSGLDELIKAGLSNGTALVITATDVDGRKTIAKTLQKIGTAISFKIDPYKQQENQAQAASFAREVASKEGKQLDRDVDLLIAEMAGGDSRTIHSEVEKLATYVGDRPSIQEEDVRSIGSWRPGGVVWDLPDAVGERNLNKALSVLDDLLFMGESSIALLFTIISRVRLLLLLSALAEKKVIRTGSDYNSFKSQLDHAPAWVSENLPADKKLNPLASHPFVLWKASSGVARYSRAELQKALETLLECNERMVSSGGDPRDTLKETLLKICMKS
jgi:DNA polymerase III subunit delta